MDFLQALIDLLRGKPGNEAIQADEAPHAMARGVDALMDPAYAAYVREAKSMGENPLGKDEWRKQNSGAGGY